MTEEVEGLALRLEANIRRFDEQLKKAVRLTKSTEDKLNKSAEKVDVAWSKVGASLAKRLAPVGIGKLRCSIREKLAQTPDRGRCEHGGHESPAAVEDPECTALGERAAPLPRGPDHGRPEQKDGRHTPISVQQRHRGDAGNDLGVVTGS